VNIATRITATNVQNVEKNSVKMMIMAVLAQQKIMKKMFIIVMIVGKKSSLNALVAKISFIRMTVLKTRMANYIAKIVQNNK
jgi:hypothetical protein